MSSSLHIDNKKKDILILVKDPTQGLDHIMLTAEAQYSINFSRSNKFFFLGLHYKGGNRFLYVNAKKTLIQSKRFGNKKSISCVSANNMKKKNRIKYTCERFFC